MSGGKKHRAAIAIAFLKDAPIIILDKATLTLDNKVRSSCTKSYRQFEER
ncbi:MAG TPA: hypothetical protein IAD11_05305 [Candidatus Stercorousia faecigallinarum]|nr:hypothetical protein [Candidatus Stercorousia faecigallinarum]